MPTPPPLPGSPGTGLQVSCHFMSCYDVILCHDVLCHDMLLCHDVSCYTSCHVGDHPGDLSSLSPDRPNPRAHLASAKSIDVIREDDEEEEDESDDVLIELGKH